MGGGQCLFACRKDQSECPVEVRLSPVEVEGPKLIFAAVRDVSERELLQEQIRENELQLMAAHKIQQYLLPHEEPTIPGLDVSGVVLPANYAAGDQYDYLDLGQETLGIVVGDVRGHGFSSALVMASTHELVRAGANLSGDIGEVLTHTNRALCDELEESFVTMILARIDALKRKLTYVNAGHPPGLLFDSDGNVKHRLQSGSLPLAVLENEQYSVSMQGSHHSNEQACNSGVGDRQRRHATRFNKNGPFVLQLGGSPYGDEDWAELKTHSVSTS